MAVSYTNARAINDRTNHAELCPSIAGPQPIQHDVECLEKAAEALHASLRELNGQLDPVLYPEGPECGSGSDVARAAACPLAERIQRITWLVQSATDSVSSTRNRLAL